MFQAPIHYTPKNPDFLKLIHEKVTRQHFMHHNGFELTKIEPGYIECEAKLDEHLTQQDGFVHGGVTSTIADLVTGFAAFSLVSKDDRVVTSDLKVSYFHPGKGDKIFARGWVIKPGNRLHYCESEVYVVNNGEYKLIAKGTAIMAIIEGKNKEIEG
ncbi:MAG: PaaI family thioesterase [Bacteroidetes bacterium]|nr:PaaI family thioesterase [Bacteroidota bacterium]